ncbi:MAG: hypothetical protein IJ598_09770 [Ruminococcus sp.]|nr:hypothetical protein [Ruminococcus sp.]
MKKFISLLLALVLVLGMTATATLSVAAAQTDDAVSAETLDTAHPISMLGKSKQAVINTYGTNYYTTTVAGGGLTPYMVYRSSSVPYSFGLDSNNNIFVVVISTDKTISLFDGLTTRSTYNQILISATTHYYVANDAMQYDSIRMSIDFYYSPTVLVVYDWTTTNKNAVPARVTIQKLPSARYPSDLPAPRLKAAKSLANGVQINWYPVKFAEKYRVFYKGSSGWKRLGDTTATSFVDTDVRSGSTYTYTVRPLSADGKAYTGSYDTRGVVITYQAPQLATPSITSLKSTPNGVQISWNAVSGAYGYRVFYKGSNGWKGMANTTATSYLDTDVRDGSTYTYTVRCINQNGSFVSGYNNTGWSHTYSRYTLAVPQVTGFQSTKDGVKISWNKVSGAYGYRVFYKGSNGWKGMENTTATSYLDTDVRDGKTYTYTVRCVDRDGNWTSGYNNTGWQYTYRKPMLATPSVTSITATAEGVKISWNKVSGAYGYRVFYKGSNGWKGMDNTTATSYVDTDVRDGSTYTYTVRCIDADGSWASGYNNTGWQYTYHKPWLATPKITSLTSTAGGVKISWNKVSGAAKYRVFYKGSSGWRSMGDTTATSFVDSDVRDGSTYTYTVRCVSADGKTFTSQYDTAGKSIKFSSPVSDYIDKLVSTAGSWAFEDVVSPAAQAGFTFMDLDFDGVNEFIVQRDGGTMHNFDAVVYTYKNGRVSKVPCSEEFIQNGNLRYYYNTSTGKYQILGTAAMAAGAAASRMIYNFTLTYTNGKVTTNYYSAMYHAVPWQSESGEHEYHYYNGAQGYYEGIGNHSEITQAAYNSINNNKMKNLVDCNMQRKFIVQRDWNKLSASAKRQQMLEAYNTFTYTKH